MTTQIDQDVAQGTLIATLAHLHEQAERPLTPARIEALRHGLTEALGVLAAFQVTE